MNPTRETYLVFVHLGRNSSPTLLPFATQAWECLPASRLFLITDQPSLWSSTFPGRVIHYAGDSRREIFEYLEFHFPVLKQQAGGYAIRTLERLFALERLGEVIGPYNDILHFESDVMSFVGPEIRNLLRTRCDRTAVPSVSATKGCASVLYSPNLDTLKRDLDCLEQLIPKDGSWLSDMQLLGTALQQRVWQELPTRPEDAWPIVFSGEEASVAKGLLFDAAAVGVYLFGLDPIHTSGLRISGHQHPDFDYDLTKWRWSLESFSRSNQGSVGARSQTGHNLVFANLHLHAKWDPGIPMVDDPEWERIIAEANGARARQETTAEPIYEFEAVPIWTRMLQRWREPKGILVKRLARKLLP
jgi:hypothetical protein